MTLASRAQAVLVMHYVEGWLSGSDHDAASEYLREHLEEIADQMVEDECALEADRISEILALCDRWDVLSKTESPTTKQIRDIALGRERTT